MGRHGVNKALVGLCIRTVVLALCQQLERPPDAMRVRSDIWSNEGIARCIMSLDISLAKLSEFLTSIPMSSVQYRALKLTPRPQLLAHADSIRHVDIVDARPAFNLRGRLRDGMGRRVCLHVSHSALLPRRGGSALLCRANLSARYLSHSQRDHHAHIDLVLGQHLCHLVLWPHRCGDLQHPRWCAQAQGLAVAVCNRGLSDVWRRSHRNVHFGCAVANVSYVYTAYLYPASDSPRYLISMSSNAVFAVMCIASGWVLRKNIWLVRTHRRLDADGNTDAMRYAWWEVDPCHPR